MSAQTSYSQNAPAGLPGLVAHDFGQADIISRLAEGDIEFGRVVSRGTDPDNQVVPGNGVTTVMGLSVRDLAREVDNNGDSLYVDESVAAVMKKGYMWVTVLDAGAPDDALYFVNATGEIGVGAPGAGQTALTGVNLETTVGAGELAIVRVNL